MKSFKQIFAPKEDIVDRAKEYRKHEDGCRFCKAARYRAHADVHRCDQGRLLWNLVFDYEGV